MWATAGTDVDFPITYMVDEDFVLPTTATAVVRNAAGSLLMTETLDVSTTSTFFTIPAVHTSLAPEMAFETRFITLRFISAGRLHEQRQVLNLMEFAAITVTPEDVRQIIGLPRTEMADHEVPIFPAFFRLQPQLPGIRPILASGGLAALQANKAIALEAALEVLPSLRLRVGQKLKSEDQEFARFQNMDWDALQLSLEAQLEEIVEDLNQVATPTVSHFGWAIPADPVTGGS